MTGQDCYTRFQKLYQERSTRWFDTSWAVEIINQAVFELGSEAARVNPTYFGMKVGNITYANNVEEYDMPVDFVKVDQVRVLDMGGPPYPHLVEIQYWQRDFVAVPNVMWTNLVQGAGTGEPYFYWTRGVQPASGANKIGFRPIPARNGANNNVAFDYYAIRGLITAIDGAQQPDLPSDWHAVVPYYMAWMAAVTDESVRAEHYLSLYNSQVEKKLLEASSGRGEAQEVIEIVDVDW